MQKSSRKLLPIPKPLDKTLVRRMSPPTPHYTVSGHKVPSSKRVLSSSSRKNLQNKPPNTGHPPNITQARR